MVSTESAEPVLFRAGISSKTFLYKKHIPLSSSRPLCRIFEDTKPGKKKKKTIFKLEWYRWDSLGEKPEDLTEQPAGLV